MTTFDTEQLKDAKESLYSLCENYDSQAFAATPVQLLIDMLTNYINPDKEDGFNVKAVYEITYDVTRIIGFLVSLHEAVEYMKFLKVQNGICS